MRDGFIKAAAVTPRIRVADTEYNARSIIDAMVSAAARGAKIAVFPELCVTGYTCGDLFLQRRLLDGALDALAEIVDASRGLDMLCAVGLPFDVRGSLYNCAAVIWDGRLLGLVPKTNIPNYGEFYEKRHFVSGAGVNEELELFGGRVPFTAKLLFEHANVPELIVGAEICEDLWVPMPPSAGLACAGATVILNPSASDEIVTKDEYRRELVRSHSGRLVCAYIYADAGEGESTQDLVYCGHDIIAENGGILAESCQGSGMTVTDIDVQKLDSERRRMGLFNGNNRDFVSVIWGGEAETTVLERPIGRNPFVPDSAGLRAKRCERILGLQSMGLKKRVEHAGVKKLIVGVSGGLDSTLALLVAARALDMLNRPRTDIIAVTMPGFGTTRRTRSNADALAEHLGAELRVVPIGESVAQHFRDIGHDSGNRNVVYENSQARERTQVLMDIANGCGGIVVGTGDLSELALGWATYNGDHMSMYGVNAGVPKTLVRYLVAYYADVCGDEELASVLRDVLDTPVSPELLPAENGEISQKTEDLVGPYELHDFYLYYAVRWGFEPAKVLRLARHVFAGIYEDEVILYWLKTFYRRFFNQQFKRSCLPDGPKVGSLTLSPRGDWRMPSDAVSTLWLEQLENLS
ncbi:MAG: NAD(+) synthase [Candidatus Heteroscillospira sp.]|jgi:NAD+ synthase (glutamine-hydrolysing)